MFLKEKNMKNKGIIIILIFIIISLILSNIIIVLKYRDVQKESADRFSIIANDAKLRYEQNIEIGELENRVEEYKEVIKKYENNDFQDNIVSTFTGEIKEIHDSNYEILVEGIIQGQQLSQYTFVTKAGIEFVKGGQTVDKFELKEGQKVVITFSGRVSMIVPGILEDVTKVEIIENSAEKLEELKEAANNAVDNLNESVFLTDFENYNPTDETMITAEKAKEIAQYGFEESAKRIAGEGADNVESEQVKLEEVYANNYFTRKDSESDKIYSNIHRACYVVQRENEMGCGIKIYVDITTGLIIGGAAYGD